LAAFQEIAMTTARQTSVYDRDHHAGVHGR
jgi:hypothetical protein